MDCASPHTLSAVVSNNSSAIATAKVTTTTEDEKVVAKFVLPVASGTVLSSATVQMGSKTVLSITDATLAGQVYNVKKTQYTMAAAATSADKGKLICTDGHIHAYGKYAACTKNCVAKIIYVGSSKGDATYKHGLALALTDEGSSGMTWEAAKTACTDKNTSATVKSASWMLPSKTQWDTMGAKSSTYTTLRDGFTSVGGSNLKSSSYWSSTEDELSSAAGAWLFNFNNCDWSEVPKYEFYPRVRACLAF